MSMSESAAPDNAAPDNAAPDNAIPDNAIPGPVTRESDRTYLEKLLLATTVILEAAPDLDLVADSLEGELDILKDRLEHALLLPEGEAR
jgi:hypothetical protein